MGTSGRATAAAPAPTRQGSPLAWLALAVLAAAHVLVAWFPFRLDPPARVAAGIDRLEDGTLVLAGQRVVARGTPPWAGTDVGSVESVTVDLEVRPAREIQVGPARILTVSDGPRDANLMIGQERGALVVRVRSEQSDAAGNPPVVVPHAFAGGGWRHIRVQVDVHGVEVLIDGLPVRRAAASPTPARAWDPGYPLLLGDERSGGRVWHGEVRRAVVEADGRAVDYLAPGALEIPERAWYVPPRLLEALEAPDERARQRSLVHLVAFVPVGVLLAAAARRSGLATVTAAGAGFAAMLQVGKIALEGRHPSVLTVLAQATGALAGAALLRSVARRVPRGRTGARRPRPVTDSTDSYTPGT